MWYVGRPVEAAVKSKAAAKARVSQRPHVKPLNFKFKTKLVKKCDCMNWPS